MNLAEMAACAVAVDKVAQAFGEPTETVREIDANGYEWFAVGDPCHCSLCLLRAEHVILRDTWSRAFRANHARRVQE